MNYDTLLNTSSESSDGFLKKKIEAGIHCSVNRQSKTNLHADELQDEEEKKSSIVRVSYNMVTAIVGAGIIGLPYVMFQSGIVMGSLLMLIAVYVSDYTLRMLMGVAKKFQAKNYEEVGYACFGNFGYYWVLVCMFLMDYGVMLTYLLILAEISVSVVNQLFSFNSEWLRSALICGLSITLIFPWCLCRDMSGLENASFLCIASVFIITIIVSVQFFLHKYEPTGEIRLYNNKFLESVGTLSFSFVIHDCCFLFYQTLERPTEKRWGKLVHVGLGTAAAINITLCLFGYFTFFDATMDNILDNYRRNDYLALSARCLYSLTMCLAYPIGLQVTRHAVYAILNKSREEPINEHEAPFYLHFGTTLLLFASTVAIACYVEDLGPVMSLTGSISSCSLGFLIPCACYLKTTQYRLDFWNHKSPGTSFSATWPKLFILVLSTALALLSILQTILDCFGINLFSLF